MSLVLAFTERAQTDAVTSRAHPTTGELEYQQKIWVYKSGSKFPTEYRIRLPSGVKCYPEGDYAFELQTNIKPDKYGSMSFDGFAPTTLIPVKQPFIDAFNKVSAQIYQQLAAPA
ncbi:single-stranded DNA-binding protein [Methylovulum psychrotolerans]|uniref:Single-stranded DNA-binding protein n=1 Tax=Methylovulum psychrotolerans TaxID=1704499 RepID=A0A1Z4C4M8_9GAMM|nr:single-stranded DNA-binding protein [Methylovulum psychrotolerans]ASF48434.1 hypothetical protein CEK71_21555 [Methylovulum psychrotolerans]